MQNGIGNKEKIQASLVNRSVLAGTTTYAAKLITPGTILQTGDGKVMLPIVPESAEIVEILKQVGFSLSTVADIDALLWGKLVINSAINPLTAIHRVPNGVLLEDTALRRKMAETVTESASIASALGIILPYADPVLEVESVCAATAENLSSMLQDVERCGETEIDAINGEIIAAALGCHIPAPQNLALYEAVKGRGFNNKVG
jgi:2-dehydropantoate 2-reductase